MSAGSALAVLHSVYRITGGGADVPPLGIREGIARGNGRRSRLSVCMPSRDMRSIARARRGGGKSSS